MFLIVGTFVLPIKGFRLEEEGLRIRSLSPSQTGHNCLLPVTHCWTHRTHHPTCPQEVITLRSLRKQIQHVLFPRWTWFWIGLTACLRLCWTCWLLVPVRKSRIPTTLNVNWNIKNLLDKFCLLSKEVLVDLFNYPKHHVEHSPSHDLAMHWLLAGWFRSEVEL